ncbi:hypothetical protein EDD15DRAFT_690252 [Pisolithus albus]|nr:hypothetical protein EDD15DRAFT_690252 [Pisolithus albus]
MPSTHASACTFFAAYATLASIYLPLHPRIHPLLATLCTLRDDSVGNAYCALSCLAWLSYLAPGRCRNSIWCLLCECMVEILGGGRGQSKDAGWGARKMDR